MDVLTCKKVSFFGQPSGGQVPTENPNDEKSLAVHDTDCFAQTRQLFRAWPSDNINQMNFQSKHYSLAFRLDHLLTYLIFKLAGFRVIFQHVLELDIRKHKTNMAVLYVSRDL